MKVTKEIEKQCLYCMYKQKASLSKATSKHEHYVNTKTSPCRIHTTPKLNSSSESLPLPAALQPPPLLPQESQLLSCHSCPVIAAVRPQKLSRPPCFCCDYLFVDSTLSSSMAFRMPPAATASRLKCPAAASTFYDGMDAPTAMCR